MMQAILILCLWVTALPSDAEAAFSKETLHAAKNRLLSIDDRKKALEALKPAQDPELISALAGILRDSEEPIAFRAAVTQALIESNHLWAATELKNILGDSSLPMQARQQALYGLWKKDPVATSPYLITLAEGQREPLELRVSAINYLSVTKANWPPTFWQNLYLNRSNPTPARAAALGGIETLGLLVEDPTLLSKVIQSPDEPTELRKLALLKAMRNMAPSDVEEELLAVVSKSENPPEIRKFALDHLADSGSENLVLELKQILARESNPDLRSQLKKLVDTLISKS